MAVLPFLLAGMMVGVDRLGRRIGGSVLPSRASPRQLLLLSAISIVSHPILDTLNTYGMRWLMPFDGRWFYGDALFIVDPWLWLALGFGVVLSRRRRAGGRGLAPERTGPARAALVFTAAYAGAMAISGEAARGIVRTDLERRGGPVDALMVAPLPATPFSRTVVAAQGDEYRLARFRWLERPRLDPASLRSFPRGRPPHPAVEAATSTPVAQRFLGWARFPSYRVEDRGAGAYLVHIMDLRYADRPGVSFGSVSIPVRLDAAPTP